ncbi:hypothetical protein NXC12_CH03412 [Rhizobium etli]|uniref:Uncharacterized protein n=1 Tax=Rhizobium etli TaxID=29449 RepID=A0AAN1BHP7_RHIET|nr:hypothetical protein REMIM1_CH03348 [Rhizobium etli bv. mimosae str. Mim1]ARQ11394.1 hypothetical protein NXC12_CH03412 [Rhizobium etli]
MLQYIGTSPSSCNRHHLRYHPEYGPHVTSQRASRTNSRLLDAFFREGARVQARALYLRNLFASSSMSTRYPCRFSRNWTNRASRSISPCRSETRITGCGAGRHWRTQARLHRSRTAFGFEDPAGGKDYRLEREMPSGAAWAPT